MTAGRRWLAWGAATLVLLAVFLLYLRPVFMVELAQQLWSCF
jgi:hypothetical protein